MIVYIQLYCNVVEMHHVLGYNNNQLYTHILNYVRYNAQ